MEQAMQVPPAPQQPRAASEDREEEVEPDSNARKASAKGLIMEVACASALTGVTLMHGGPFGACVVRNGIFVSVAHNTVLMDSDPTCHAEMNAIRYACAALGTHDLSDCELFTTCEPCPMCLGACSWSRIRKVYTGVDRFTAAQFGFDDKVFYDELEAHSGHWAVPGSRPDNAETEHAADPDGQLLMRCTSPSRQRRVLRIGQTAPNVMPSMLNMYWGVEKERVRKILGDPNLNRTFRRRVGEPSIGFHGGESRFGPNNLHEPGVRRTQHADSEGEDNAGTGMHPPPDVSRRYFAILENAIEEAVETGQNKEREVFASLIVDAKGDVVSVAVNEVLKRRDCTATSEVLAIRRAAKRLGTHVLSGCSMYSTVEPCVMSLGAVLWSRLDNIFYGVSQHAAARFGFEEGLLHYRELFADPDTVRKVMDTEVKVGFAACEQVFKRWSTINGIVY